MSISCLIFYSPVPTYEFVAEPFGACSVSCGCGIQMRNVTCQETLNDTVTDVSDGVCVRQGLPVPPRQRTCNNFTCPNWTVRSPFGQVSHPCTHVTVSPLHPHHCVTPTPTSLCHPCTHVTVTPAPMSLSPLHPCHCHPCTHVTVTPAPTSLCHPCTYLTVSPLHPLTVSPLHPRHCHPCTHITVSPLHPLTSPLHPCHCVTPAPMSPFPCRNQFLSHFKNKRCKLIFTQYQPVGLSSNIVHEY